MSGGAWQVLGLIGSLSRRHGYAFMFQNKMAARLGCTVRTLQRRLRELREAGMITVQKRQHMSAIYTVVEKPVKNVVSGVVSGVVSANPHIGESNAELKASSQLSLAFPQQFIEHEAGGRTENPEWRHLQGVLRAALPRIRAARNPDRYFDAVWKSELRAIRKPVQSEALRRGRKQA